MRLKRVATLLFLISICIFGLTSCAKKTLQEKIVNMNEQEQFEAVRKDSSSIQYIKNPSEVLQLETVRKYGSSIQYIKNPSEAVQLEAVKKDDASIQYIENPSEAVQLEAVKKYGYRIKYIKNPSEAVKSLASKTINFLSSSNKVKIKEFTLSDNNIKIEVINDNIYAISNLTTQFIEVKTISFYYKEGIYSINNINLPPKSSKELPFNDSSRKDINANELVNFGFAVNYLLNGKSIDLYKVKQYPMVEFVYKR